MILVTGLAEDERFWFPETAVVYCQKHHSWAHPDAAPMLLCPRCAQEERAETYRKQKEQTYDCCKL